MVFHSAATCGARPCEAIGRVGSGG